MIKRLRNLVVIATSGALVGCATLEPQDQEAVVAVGGCVVGGVIGGLIAGPRGAVIGCAAAGALGWVVVANYQATQARNAATDANKYKRKDPDFYALHKGGDSPAVKIRTAGVSPTKAKPGEEVTVKADFSLVAPASVDKVKVECDMILLKDGKTLSKMKLKPEERTAGGWAYGASIPIPKDAEPGTYVVKQKISVGSGSYDEREMQFKVSS